MDNLKHLISADHQQSLQELVAQHRKLQGRSDDTSQFMAKVYQSVQNELTKNNDIEVKRVAAEKLMYLISQGFEGAENSAFNVIELMGCSHDVQTK